MPIYKAEEFHELLEEDFVENPMQQEQEIVVVENHNEPFFTCITYFTDTENFMVFHQAPDKDPEIHERLTWYEAIYHYRQLVKI